MFESAGCHTLVSESRSHSTVNGSAARSCNQPTCFRNAKWWSTPGAVRSEKTAIGWIFKQLLGHPALGPTESKMQILHLPSKPNIQVNAHGVSAHFPNFQKDLGSLDRSSRENVMEQMFGCRFALPCECGDPPYALRLRGNCKWKMTSKQVLSSSMCYSAQSILGMLSSFEEGKASTVCFQASILQELFSF